MKKVFICIVLLSLSFLLCAKSVDEAINYVLDSGGFVDHNGTLYFISDTIMSEDDLPGESDAQHYVAQTAYIFNLVCQNWEAYSSTSGTDKIKRCSKIACPYTNGYQDYLLEIPMYEMKDVISQSDYDSQGDECFSDFLDYVRSHGDIRNLDMWLEE